MPFWRQSSREGLQHEPIPRHLPFPSGPHAVGFQDVMTGGDPSTVGVFVRVYYPSALPSSDTVNQWHLWPVWADDDYLLGFVKFMQAMLARWPSWAPKAEYKYVDQMSYIAPVMHLGCTYVWKLLNGKVHCPILKNVAISAEKKWPVIVFSHGMGCSRFAYSQICADLASHGFVVAATEHREGSSCLSFHMEKGKKTLIPHLRVEEGQKEYLVRNQQLKHRVREVKDTLSLMIDLNNGANIKNVLTDEIYQTEIFKDCLDLSNPILTGHSFGGATSLLALQEDPRFKRGIVLDSWLFPLRDEVFQPQQPLVFINTESFMNKSNIARMKMFMTQPDLERRMFFIKGSVHQNHIDAPAIFQSNFIKKIIGMYSDTDPGLVLALNNKLMLHFIWSHLGLDTPQNIVDFLQSKNDVLVEANEKDESNLLDEECPNSKSLEFNKPEEKAC